MRYFKVNKIDRIPAIAHMTEFFHSSYFTEEQFYQVFPSQIYGLSLQRLVYCFKEELDEITIEEYNKGKLLEELNK